MLQAQRIAQLGRDLRSWRKIEYLRRAYQVADDAVQRIIEAVGQEPNGRPRSNIIVVSGLGFAPFHTAANINNLLASHGLDPTKVRAITSGPAVNAYINLQGREPDGIVSREEYITLQHQIAGIFGQLTDTNPNYSMGQTSSLVFERVYRRPLPTDVAGLGTSEFIGQDGGAMSSRCSTSATTSTGRRHPWSSASATRV